MHPLDWYEQHEVLGPSLGLHYASRFALHQSVKYLLDVGPDPNPRGDKYGSVIQAASTSGNLQIVQMLLEHGADVDIGGDPHGSALFAAVEYGHINVLNLLLQHGATFGALAQGMPSILSN